METAPLTLAHTHARNAALETKRSNPLAASEEHDLAAAEFATAAEATADHEARRILALLEQHHKRLGHILKSGNPLALQETASPSAPTTSVPPTNSNAEGRSADRLDANSTEVATHPPRLSNTGRATARDLSSSIASNLASARGIPNPRARRTTPVSPLVSNQHAGGTIAGEDHMPKTHPEQSSESEGLARRNARPSWAPPGDMDSQRTPQEGPSSAQPSAVDAPFQQFYNTFESLISKISAPLAFASLPLNNTPSTPVEPIQKPASPKTTFFSSAKPETLHASVDYSQLISRAALRAVRNNGPGSAGHPSESFYVVPTTGGTVTYAEIMNRVEREEARHHRRDFSNASMDDFVDALSTVLPDPPKTSRKNEPTVNGKTMEELTLENQALKHLSDNLAKRLHVFEMSAQTSSAALAQSIRSLHLSPVTTPETSRGKPVDSSRGAGETQRMAKRMQELEEILKKYDTKLKDKREENAKLKDQIIKYKDKWENLKAGAKARRENKISSGDSPRKAVPVAETATPSKSKDRELREPLESVQ